MKRSSFAPNREQDLKALKLAMDSKNKISDPIGYQKAYTAYNTLLYGPRWLEEEKKKIATRQVRPIVDNYTKRYNTLKKSNDNRNNQHDIELLKQEISNSTDIINRLSFFNQSLPKNSSSTSNIIFDGIVAVLGIIIVFQIYEKMRKRSSPKLI